MKTNKAFSEAISNCQNLRLSTSISKHDSSWYVYKMKVSTNIPGSSSKASSSKIQKKSHRYIFNYKLVTFNLCNKH